MNKAMKKILLFYAFPISTLTAGDDESGSGKSVFQ
jgi:hypothetical protein